MSTFGFFLLHLWLSTLVSASPQECKIEKLTTKLRPVFIVELEWLEPEVSLDARGSSATFHCNDGFTDTTISESAVNVTCSGSDYIYQGLSYKYFDLMCNNPGASQNMVRVPANQMTSPLLHCNDPQWRVYRKIYPDYTDFCFDLVRMTLKYLYSPASGSKAESYAGELRWFTEGKPPVPVPSPSDWSFPAGWVMNVHQRNASDAFPVVRINDDQFARDMILEGWQCAPLTVHLPGASYEGKDFKCNRQDFLTHFNKMEHCVTKEGGSLF